MAKLKPKLVRTFDEANALFSAAVTGKDIADFFEIQYGQLLYLLYRIPDKTKYTSFEKPKRNGGTRTIHKPCTGIDILQKKLKPFLDNLYKVKSPVHGFVRDRSIVSNAKCHQRQRYVLNIDIEDFYGSINFGRVRGLFLSHPFGFSNKAASILAQLVCFENRLPQGASTSPVISNFIASDLDKRLISIAKRYHFTYSRYADDITFSTNKSKFPTSIASFDGTNPVTGKTVLGELLGKSFMPHQKNLWVNGGTGKSPS